VIAGPEILNFGMRKLQTCDYNEENAYIDFKKRRKARKLIDAHGARPSIVAGPANERRLELNFERRARRRRHDSNSAKKRDYTKRAN